MRILVYPIGTKDELEFARNATVVPAVGERLQILDRTENNNSRSPWYEVISREWYCSHYGPNHQVMEVALTVKTI